MTITEMIKKLEAIREVEGDIRVTVYDEYTAAEGWDYKNEELWENAVPTIDMVIDDNDKEIEKVVCIYSSLDDEDEDEEEDA